MTLKRAGSKELTQHQLNKILDNMLREPRTQVFSIELINDKVNKGELILSPEYQREYILKNGEASKFVESIFLGCVIPEIQLFEEKDGSLEVLDGQQRTTSLIRFLNNKYRLVGLKDLPELNGFLFKELPIALQNKFKNYSMATRVMKNTDDINYKYLIFERLNTGSKKLSTQEVRNCVFMGPALSMAKELSKERDVLDALKCQRLNIKRQELVEFVVREMAIAKDYPNLTFEIRYTINNFLKEANEMSEEGLNALRRDFMKTVDLMNLAVDRISMMNKNGVTSKTNVESVFLTLNKIIKGNSEITPEMVLNNKDKFNEGVQFVINECEDYLATQTATKVNIKRSIVNRVAIMDRELTALFK